VTEVAVSLIPETVVDRRPEPLMDQHTASAFMTDRAFFGSLGAGVATEAMSVAPAG